MTDDSIFAPGFGLRPAPDTFEFSDPATGGKITARRTAFTLPAADPDLDLRAWRVSQGLSQFEAAVRLGVSLSSWIRWETKHVPELRRAWLKEVCK